MPAFEYDGVRTVARDRASSGFEGTMTNHNCHLCIRLTVECFLTTFNFLLSLADYPTGALSSKDAEAPLT